MKVIVLIGFWEAERWTFFALSLSIISLAMISYAMAFEWRYTSPDSLSEAIGIFMTALPFSPLLPLFFYVADTKNNALVEFIDTFCWFDTYMDDWTIDDDRSKLRKFMLEKLAKHMVWFTMTTNGIH